MEKQPFSSKKFIAFFFSMIVIAGVMVTALLTQQFGWEMVTFMSIGIFTEGFLSVGYILKQGSLDKFMRGMEGIKDAIDIKSME